MTLIYSFLFSGLICLIGQIILDNSKLTYGHITSLFVVVGSFLGIFGIYDRIINVVGAGANILIVSFGNTLLNSAFLGYKNFGLIGLFNNMLANVSLGITTAVIFSFIISCIAKVKD